MIPDLLTLERLAKAATPGTRRPYHYSSPRGARQSWCIGTDDSGLCGIAMNFKTKEDAEFHAACSPDTILGLVARIKELECAVHVCCEPTVKERDASVARVRELEEVLTHLLQIRRIQQEILSPELLAMYQKALTPSEPRDG